MTILDDNRILNYRGLYDFLEKLKGFFIKKPTTGIEGQYLRLTSNGGVEWAYLPPVLTFIDGFEPTSLIIGEQSGRTLTTEVETSGDIYIATSSGKLFEGTVYELSLEAGDYIIFRRDVASGTSVQYSDIVYIESSPSVVAGTANLSWNTEITLATVEGIDIKAKLPAHPLPTGNIGDVYYVDLENSNHIDPKLILTYNAFAETDAEINALKTRSISLSEIYNDWTAFAHNGDYETSHASSSSQQELAQEIANPKSFWTYNATAGTMVCSKNSVTYLGFVDDKHFVDNYTMLAVLKSTDSDNDSISLVIAYYKDSLNKEYTLSVVRTRQNSESHTAVDYNSDGSARTNRVIPMWAIVYNYKQADSRLIASGTITGDASGAWSGTSGTTVKIVRNGDNVTCYASPYGSTTLDTSNALTVNLNDIDVLNVFKGKRQYGVGCFSQPASTFASIEIQLANTIYDMRNGTGWVYSSGSWTSTANKLYTDFEVGRILNSLDFNKSYYIDVPYHNIKINDDRLTETSAVSTATISSNSTTISYDSGKYIKASVQNGDTLTINVNLQSAFSGTPYAKDVIVRITNTSSSTSSAATIKVASTGTTGTLVNMFDTRLTNNTGVSLYGSGTMELVFTFWDKNDVTFNGGVK